jgi:hypothetical protein
MRKVWEWLVVTAFFVALQLIAAGVVWLFGLPLVRYFPDAREQWLPGLLLGMLAVAAALGVAFMVISRKRRPRQARDPA